MYTRDDMDEATLHAYVDGELDADSERSVLRAMNEDSRLREEVCRLRRAKDWMRSGFGDAEPREQPLPRAGGLRRWAPLAFAASLAALLVGGAGGLLGYNFAEHGFHAGVARQDPTRVLLHLDESRPEKFAAVLDYAERLLERNRDAGVQVEVIANAAGIDLMRVGASPFEQRVREMSARYRNLQFVACANALRNLRARGVEPELIDHVKSDTTAIDEIVRRIRAGWTYRKVDDLPGA
ncbi:MAG TPA: hypothetical protein ENK05_06280 [Gammaproteobacteria bacterium]|nr:hypothetical protein [Gammaproteobacteria bacterium]